MSGTLGGAFGIALSTTVFSMLQLNYAPSVAATVTFIVSIVLIYPWLIVCIHDHSKTVKS